MPKSRRKRKQALEIRLMQEWGRLDAHGARGKTQKQLRERKNRIGGILVQLRSRD